MESILIAFITTSILISPNIVIFTGSLGLEVALIRLFSSLSTGVISGVFILYFSKSDKSFLELETEHRDKKHKQRMPGLEGIDSFCVKEIYMVL